VVRPKQLFLENVSAILSNGLGTVLGDLASLGYDTRWLCIRASDVGAPHHRDRWFLLATYADELRPTTGTPSQTRKTFSDQHGDGSQEERGRVKLNAWPCGLCADVAYADSERGCSGEAEWQDAKNVGQPSECSEFGYWDAECLVGRVANGIPHRVHRLKGLGNAQVPLQAAAAYRLLGGL
jgi:DNA (cytosine-5)-methyltransferase 1